MEKKRFLWFTDIHLYSIFPWTFIKFFLYLRREKPDGLFLTGDISNGLFLRLHLTILSLLAKCPIYFVLGNHDMHTSSIEETRIKLRKICKKHLNLIWMTESGIIPINNDVCLIGAEGWYDARIGNPNFLKFTIDWWLIAEFRRLSSMEERVNYFRKFANRSADIIKENLTKALKTYKTIYIITHFPPWKEATRDIGTFLEPFWLPYNVNMAMGEAIESVMKENDDKRVIVLAGHTHQDCQIHVSNNIECRVSSVKYYGLMPNKETIII